MKKNILLSLASLLIALTSANALAQRQARPDNSTGDPKQAICTFKSDGTFKIEDSSVFKCSGSLNKITFAQIFAKGYSISSYTFNSYDAVYSILIEKR